MIRKILFRSQPPLQLLVAVFGAFVGMLILLVSVQFYLDIQQTLSGNKELIGADYLVLQKKVGTLNTFSIGSIYFDEDEIENIRKASFVKRVGVFEASRFKVFATISGFESAPDLLTEAYFEAVPDEFIDVESKDWSWKEGDATIPVILPGAYLDAFNFGFGPAQGLPPLSEKAFRLLQLKIALGTNQGTLFFKGKIVGFSDRINTILVPENFLHYANDHFATKPAVKPARLMLAVDDLTDPALAKFIDDHGYDTNQENLKGSRVKTVLVIVLSLFLFIGAVIIMLALLGFIQYAQVIISRVQHELKILLLMGFSHRLVAAKYWTYFAVIFLFIGALAFTVLFWVQSVFVTYLHEFDFVVEKGVYNFVWLCGGTFLIFFVLLNGWGILNQIRKLAKNLQ